MKVEEILFRNGMRKLEPPTLKETGFTVRENSGIISDSMKAVFGCCVLDCGEGNSRRYDLSKLKPPKTRYIPSPYPNTPPIVVEVINDSLRLNS